MKRLILLVVFFATLLAHTMASAGELLSSVVTHQDGVYSLRIQMRVQGDAQVIRGLVTDFDHLEKLDDFIVGSQQLVSNVPGERRMRIDTRDCFMLYCATLVQEQKVRSLSEGELEVVVVPENSDYDYGRSVWTFVQEENNITLLTVEAVMQPKLWVPPLVGPEIVASRMRLHAEGMINNMEQLAASMTAEERRRVIAVAS